MFEQNNTGGMHRKDCALFYSCFYTIFTQQY